MGYYSDFNGRISATTKDADAAKKIFDEFGQRETNDPHGFAVTFNAKLAGDKVHFDVSLYEKWYDCEDDVKALVQWLKTSGCHDIEGDIDVQGEEPGDLWRMHVEDGNYRRQTARVVYE